MFMRRIQGLSLWAIFLRHCEPRHPLTVKIYIDRPRGTPAVGALKAKGIPK